MIYRYGIWLFAWIWASAGLAQCLDHVVIGTWNTKHLGRANFAYEDAGKLLANLDLIALQEVNTTLAGKQALIKLQHTLTQQTGDLWCSIISGVPSGARERYAFLWRARTVTLGYTAAEIQQAACPQAAERAGLQHFQAEELVREPAGAYFFAPDDQRFIYLASVHLVPTAKKPEKEVPFLLKSMEAQVEALRIPGLVAMLAGDFNLASSHPAFKLWQNAAWHPALPGKVKTSLKQKQKAFSQAYDNVWWQDFALGCAMSYEVINPYEVFPRKGSGEIYREISDHAPVAIYYKKVTPLPEPEDERP